VKLEFLVLSCWYKGILPIALFAGGDLISAISALKLREKTNG